jgi:uncharacterized glyoxalase superfamily protein PhnB
MSRASLKPAPAGWPRISASICYQDAAAAIDWLCRAFGFELRLKVEGADGGIVHSELTFGSDGLIMVAGESRADAHWLARSPKSLHEANTQGLAIYVDDVDAHCAQAQAAGARIARPLQTTDYGADYWTDRSYGALDPEEHIWFFMQRIPRG